MRLSQAMATFEAWQRAAGRSPATIGNYATSLSSWSRAAFGDDDPDLDEIGPDDVQRWIGSRREDGVADSTLTTALTALSSFLTWCERQRLLERSPMAGVMRPSLASSVDEEYDFLDDAELDLLLRVARDGWDEEVVGRPDRRTPARRAEDHLLVSLMGLAGLRVSEVCSLDTADVTERDVHVRSGKGRRARRVPTDPELWEALQRHTPAGMHLFGLPTHPERRLTRNAVELRLPVLARAAGLSQRVTPHVLRHSFATNTWRASQALVPLRDLLGHRSTQTTSRYTHSRDDERRAVLAEARAARRRARAG